MSDMTLTNAVASTIDAIERLASANNSAEATDAMAYLARCKFMLMNIAGSPPTTEAVSANPAFFEFALMVVKRATEINRNHVQAVAHSRLDGKAEWTSKGDPGNNTMRYVETAAVALLLAVEPPTVDIQPN